MRYIFLILGLFPSLILCAQADKVTLSGYIKDGNSGEELIGATIQVKGSSIGASTNIYGFYSLTLEKGNYELVVNYLGYRAQTFSLNLTEDLTRDFELRITASVIGEVVVESDEESQNKTLEDVGVGTMKIHVKQLETLPVLFGEKDILKSIQLLPGINASSEGSTGLSVRGGKPDQNLILLDEAIVYNPSHFLGFFSVFNSDALKDLTVYKGGIPAQYGGRAASVLDVYMKNGNKKRFGLSGGIGLISSRLTFEGPIVKDKGSFILSGRATYLDLIATAFSQGDVTLGFWDLNLKANYSLSKKDRLFLSGYAGQDRFLFQGSGLRYGNYTITARWNRTLTDQVFSNTSFFFSDYRYGYEIGIDDFLAEESLNFVIDAGIRDYAIKQDYSYYANPRSTWRFGWASTYHQFQPSRLQSSIDSLQYLLSDQLHAIESGLYASHEWQITDQLKAVYGLRLSMFNQVGPGDIKTYSESNEVLSSRKYKLLENVQTYVGIEPRLALSYAYSPTTTFELGYHRIHQYVHLLSNSTIGVPNDMWFPSTQIVQPEIADQVSLGVKQSFLDKKITVSLEGYYKHLQNQVDYEAGADILLNPIIEAQILNGLGWSYGGELLVQTNFGNFSGWVSYTLSKTQYQFDEINGGRPYNARQDRTHDIALVGTYELKKRWVFSAAWIYQSGINVTLPTARYVVDGQVFNYYTERNGFRYPSSHRLDVAITFRNKLDKKFRSSFTLGVYNVYNRQNPYFISLRPKSDNNLEVEAVQTSLFGIIPTLTWNFSF